MPKSEDRPPQQNHRINFRINYCSSQDSSFPSSQLTLQSPQAKGWQSQRFCSYPQIIVIQLLEPSIIHKLTFLSHQNKICTKIDIQSKPSQSQEWKKLGYTCMQSNMNTNYQARQLRTVKLNKQLCRLFKFTFNSNYHNIQNTFNQIGLIAISVHGERINNNKNKNDNFNSLNNNNNKSILLSPGSILDKETLDKLRQLEYMKRQAIDNNEFQKATEIKNQIDKLKNGIQALAILQKLKRQAIKKQDYDQAKKIYQKMQKIRGPLPRVSKSSNDRYNQNNQMNRKMQLYTPNINSFTNKANKSISYDVPMSNSIQIQQFPSPILQLKKDKKKSIKPNNNTIVTNSVNFDQIKIKPINKNIFDQEYLLEEEKKYQGEQKYNNNDNNNNVKPKQFLKKAKTSRPGNNVNNKSVEKNNNQNDNNNNNEYEYDQQQLKQLQLPAQCSQYFPVIPQLFFKNIFSSNKQLREQGIDQVLNLLNKIPQQDNLQKLFINGVIFIVNNTIQDKILSILLKSIDLFGMTFKQFKPKSNQISSNNISYIKNILKVLSQYIGHSNQKLKQQSQDVYIILPKHKFTSKQLCIQTITLSQKIDKIPKIIISKLQMLGRLIKKYPEKKQTIGRYQDVIEYAKRYLNDKNNQVKNTAIKLILFLMKIIGKDDVMNSLANVKEQTKNSIRDKYEEWKLGNNNTNNHNNINNIHNKQDKSNHIMQINKNKSNQKKQNIRRSPQINKKVTHNQVTNNESSVKNKLPKSPRNKKESLQQSPKKQQPQPLYQPSNLQYKCQFCFLFDKRFQNQNFRDIHLFKHCPMITLCVQCNQAIQIQYLNQHLLSQCDNKKYYKKCPRCKQSIPSKIFNNHADKKQCIPAKGINIANRCPLCHEDIEVKNKGWLKHLVQEGCPCSNRK